MNEIINTIKEVFDGAGVLHLSTASNNNPWATALLFVGDESYNIYWLSRKETRHSSNLNINSNCALAATIIKEDGKGIGIQAEGKAIEVQDEMEKQIVHDKYHERHHKPKHRSREDAQKEMEAMTLYKFTPAKIYVINEPLWGHERKELDLKL